MVVNIKSVEIKDYCSHVPKDIISKLLIKSKCDRPGKLELTLKPGKEFIQKGPYIIPPIRWLDTLEKNAEFYIVCKTE